MRQLFFVFLILVSPYLFAQSIDEGIAEFLATQVVGEQDIERGDLTTALDNLDELTDNFMPQFQEHLNSDRLQEILVTLLPEDMANNARENIHRLRALDLPSQQILLKLLLLTSLVGRDQLALLLGNQQDLQAALQFAEPLPEVDGLPGLAPPPVRLQVGEHINLRCFDRIQRNLTRALSHYWTDAAGPIIGFTLLFVGIFAITPLFIAEASKSALYCNNIRVDDENYGTCPESLQSRGWGGVPNHILTIGLTLWFSGLEISTAVTGGLLFLMSGNQVLKGTTYCCRKIATGVSSCFKYCFRKVKKGVVACVQCCRERTPEPVIPLSPAQDSLVKLWRVFMTETCLITE